MRILDSSSVYANKYVPIGIRTSSSRSKVCGLCAPLFRRDLATASLFLLLFGHVRARGDDCVIRWQEVTKQLDALAVTKDKLAAAQVLHQFVLDTERPGQTCIYLPFALNQLGSLEQDQGHYQNAESLYRQAIKLQEAHAADLELARALNNLASAYLETGRAKQGEPFRRRSLELRISLLGESNPAVALGYLNLAADLFQEKKYAAANVMCRKAILIWKSVAPEDIRLNASYASLALICIAQRNYNEAVELAEKAVHNQEQKRADADPFLARYTYILALAYRKVGRLQESRTAFLQAIDYVTAQHAPNLAFEADVLQDYCRLLRQLGYNADAKAVAQRVRALRSQVRLAEGMGYSVSVDDLQRDDKPVK